MGSVFKNIWFRLTNLSESEISAFIILVCFGCGGICLYKALKYRRNTPVKQRELDRLIHLQWASGNSFSAWLYRLWKWILMLAMIAHLFFSSYERRKVIRKYREEKRSQPDSFSVEHHKK